MLKTVVLYSGRWYVGHMGRHAKNHMKYLIGPYGADVVVTVSASQLFCGNETLFDVDLRRAFGHHLKRHQFFREDEAFSFTNSHPNQFTPWKWTMLNSWYYQFNNVRRSLELAGDEYSIYIRARIDTLLLQHAANLLPKNQTVYAIRTSHRGPMTPAIKDWFYVTDWGGMNAIADTRMFHHDLSMRCFGLCPEEQVEYHVKARGYSLQPGNVSMVLRRLHCLRSRGATHHL